MSPPIEAYPLFVLITGMVSFLFSCFSFLPPPFFFSLFHYTSTFHVKLQQLCKLD